MFENHLKMSHLNFQAQKFPSFSVDSKIEFLYENSSVFIRIYGKWDFFCNSQPLTFRSFATIVKLLSLTLPQKVEWQLLLFLIIVVVGPFFEQTLTWNQSSDSPGDPRFASNSRFQKNHMALLKQFSDQYLEGFHLRISSEIWRSHDLTLRATERVKTGVIPLSRFSAFWTRSLSFRSMNGVGF